VERTARVIVAVRGQSMRRSVDRQIVEGERERHVAFAFAVLGIEGCLLQYQG